MADERSSDFALLREAAQDAARLALTYWKRSLSTKSKADGSPVTEADLAVDALLAAKLRPARPDYGWLSEESAEHVERVHRRCVWALDPIDGTKGFIQGQDDWTIALALLEDGAPVLAVVVNPVREEIFEARAGSGAFLNGRKIYASETADLPGARVIVSDNLLTRRIWRSPWPELTPVKANSVAYRMALVACGKADAAFALSPKSEWDIAAGALLVTEAGGRATTPSGYLLRFNTADAKVQGFLAAAPNLHQMLVERLSGALDDMKGGRRV